MRKVPDVHGHGSSRAAARPARKPACSKKDRQAPSPDFTGGALPAQGRRAETRPYVSTGLTRIPGRFRQQVRTETQADSRTPATDARQLHVPLQPLRHASDDRQSQAVALTFHALCMAFEKGRKAILRDADPRVLNHHAIAFDRNRDPPPLRIGTGIADDIADDNIGERTLDRQDGVCPDLK